MSRDSSRAAASVVVNGRVLGQRTTGVQRYAQELIIRLTELRDDLVIVHPQSQAHMPFTGAQHLAVGTRDGHFWEQTDLPRFLRGSSSPLLVNLGSTAPAFYRNQICTHHDVAYIRYPSSYSRKFRLAYRAIVPRALHAAHTVVTSSEFGRSELEDAYRIPRSRVEVIPGAAYVSGASEQHQSDSPYFLTVSSPSTHKNFSRLVEAFSTINTHAKLYIVGQAAPHLSGMTKTYTEDSRIQFLGRVDDAHLARLYGGATAYIIPSLYEGFGLPPLEAQQAGCPVISARAASLPEVLGDSAEFFDPTDVADIRAAISRVDQDAELRARLRHDGYQNCAKYSWDDSAQQLSTLIDSVLQSTRGGQSPDH